MTDELFLSGKTALITGASRGIGRAIVRLFADNGARIIVNDQKEESLDAVIKEVKKYTDVELYPVYFDVSNPEEVATGFRTIFKIAKRLDILVNNAGIIDDALIGMVTPESVHRIFSTNTYGTLYCCQYAARMMMKQRKGSIINISSIVGLKGKEGQVVYSGSKAAIIGITRSLAKELAPANIRVNAIAPGFIDTDMVRSLPLDKYEEWLKSVKMKRIGKPIDVANVALFLASDLSAYVTEQVISVDGGMIL